MKTKEELLDILLSNHNYIRKICFIKNFPENYNELIKINFPDYFSFSQKVYHYVHNDPQLKLGICKQCGRRCSYRSFNDGYQLFCSIQCRNKNIDTISIFKETYKKKSQEEKDSIHKKQSLAHTNKSNEEKNKIIQKIKKTKKEKYGDENYNNRTLMKITKKEKYGDENYNNVEKYKQSIKNRTKEEKEQTRLKKQNSWNKKSNEEKQIIINKVKSTLFNHFDGKWNFQTKEFKEKSKITCLQKYGVKYNTQSKDIQNKAKLTHILNFRNNHPETFNISDSEVYDLYYKEISNKSFETRKNNKTTSSSKCENELILWLNNMNITFFHNYNKDSRYPYHVDFYLPEYDLFIEIQGNWTHGFHPFNTLSKDDINILNIWKEKSKTSDYYKTAINVWTNTDVIKRNTAKNNNLNYLEIFSININDIITEIKKRINI